MSAHLREAWATLVAGRDHAAYTVACAAIRDLQNGIIDTDEAAARVLAACDDDADMAMTLFAEAVAWWNGLSSYRDRNNQPIPRTGLIQREALRPGIVVENLRTNGRQTFGVVKSGATVLAYRGFGSWQEMKDSIRSGRWRSQGGFVVRSQEGETQMAMDMNSVIEGSGFHRLRGTGFLGIIEADIQGLPFSTMMSPMEPGEARPAWIEGTNGGLILDPTDPTRGVIYPDLGLGLGINGGIPLERIRTVYEIEGGRVARQWPFGEWESHVDRLRDNPDWSGAKKVVVSYPLTSKQALLHILDQNQITPMCGQALGQARRERALIDPDDAYLRPESIRNFWSRQGTTFSIRESQRCPKCFKGFGAYLRPF